MRPTIKPADRREGVALLIVLGMLSLLLIMALSLSATMRAEQSVADVHAESMTVRSLVPVAIDRAMLEMERRPFHNDAGTATTAPRISEGGFAAAFRFDGGSTNVVQRNGEAIYVMSPERMWQSSFASGDVKGAPIQTADKSLLTQIQQMVSPAARSFFSEDIQDELDLIAAGGGGGSRKMKWLDIDMYRGALEVGRFMFIAENMSDFVDINEGFVPRNTVVRQSGIDPFEIQYSGDPVLNKELNDLYGELSSYVRFDTVAEMRSALGYTGNRHVKEIAPLSYFPADVFHPPLGEMVYKAVVTNNFSDADVRRAFKFLGENGANAGAGVTSTGDLQAGILLNNLRDYIDEDLMPVDIQQISCEPVPMINELVMPDKVQLVGVNGFEYNFEMDYALELWNPFVMLVSSNFAVSGEFDVTVTLTHETAGAIPPLKPTDPVEVTFPSKTFGVNGSGSEFQIFSSTDGGVGAAEFTVTSTESNRLTKVEVDVTWKDFKVHVDSDAGPIVDQIVSTVVASKYEKSFSLADPWPPAAAVDIPLNGSDRVFAVVDPRDNYVVTTGGAAADNWLRQDFSEQSMGTTNLVTRNYLNTDVNCDGDTKMYTRNNTMRSPGEIGYLPYNPLNDPSRKWHTIRLLPKQDGIYHRVFDYFATTNAPIIRGMMNPNTTNYLHLAHVFTDMPIDWFPGQLDPDAEANIIQGKGPGYLSYNVEGLVLADMIALRDDALFPYLTAGDIAGNRELRRYMENDLGITTEIGVESLIRNSVGVMSTRNNTFKLLVMVQGAGQRGLARAMATIWRDPFPIDGTNEHRTFVRSIQYIADSAY